MLQYLIMCRSLTYAQRASAALERAGISAPIARAPQELTTEGCGYSVKVRGSHFQDALRAFTAKKLPHGRLFRIEANGAYTEGSG